MIMFFSDYYNSTDLHICVTTSNGTIVEFDRCGLRWHRDKGESKWNQSLLVKQIPDAWMEHWDDILNKVNIISTPPVFLLLYSLVSYMYDY